ncbi:MAG TPA: YwiC-like family protein [Micromonospora sp.]
MSTETPSRVEQAAPARRSSAGARRRQFIPPQHGAWAMLLVPYLAGLLVVGARWLHAPLLVAWIGGYLWSYYVFQALKSRRPRRFRAQLLVYGAVTLPAALLVLALRPAVLWYAPVFAVLLGINAVSAWRRRERTLLNDLAAVAQSCLMVAVVVTVAGADPWAGAGAFAACALYFAGTAFFVKTMIRERDNRTFHRWSLGYHAAALVASLPLGPAAAAFFAWTALRAWLLPRRRLAPVQIGLIEIVNSVALLAVIGTTLVGR